MTGTKADRAAAQRRYRERQKERGLKQVLLWVKPEDVDLIKEAAESPHMMARLRKEVRAKVEKDIRSREWRTLHRKQRRDLLRQARRTVQLIKGGDNEWSPMGVRISPRPTEHLVTMMRRNMWTWDPVIAVWRLPWMHERYASSIAMCRELERSGYVIEWMAARR